MAFSSNEISYTLYSEDLNNLNEAVSMVEEVMLENDGLKDVSSSKEESYVEYTFKVDQEELLQYGLTTGQIYMALNPNRTDNILTTIEKDGTNLNVIVKHDEEIQQPESIEEMLNIEIETALGTMMPLSELVTVEEGTTLNTLARSEGQYYATVDGTIIYDDISKVSAEVDEKISELELPKGVTTGVAGVTADMEETFTQLGFAMLRSDTYCILHPSGNIW